MIILGVCGPSGAGKSTFCGVFKTLGCMVIDCDRVYAKLVTPPSTLLDKLAAAFGNAVIKPSGELDRKALSDIVFSDKKSLDKLNLITFDFIIKRIKKTLNLYKNSGVKTVLIDAPLLFESGLDKICDYTLCVIAPRESSVQRLVKRENAPESSIAKRLDKQISCDDLKAKCDFAVVNDLSVEELKIKAKELYEKLCGGMG